MCVRSLNELRVLLLESPRHSSGVDRDLSREVHKAEWRVKEQKLQDDIKTLREKLLLLVRHVSSDLLLQPSQLLILLDTPIIVQCLLT